MMQTEQFNETWGRLSKTITHVIKGIPIASHTEWTNSFLDVYKICIAYPVPLHRDMYKNLETLLTAHTMEIYEEALSNEDKIVQKYARSWKTFNEGAKSLNLLFGHFNDLFVVPVKQRDPDFIRISEDDHLQVYKEIEQLALDTWKKIMIEPLGERLVGAVLSEITAVRRGPKAKVIAASSEIPKSFVSVERFNLKLPHELYENMFEKPFLKETDAYYKAEAEKLLGNCTCSEYMKQILELKADEEFRSKSYLDGHSFRKAAKCVQQRLIFDHITFLQTGCIDMIKTNQQEDLFHMYLLLRSDSTYLRYMSEELQKHVSAKGIQTLTNVAAETNNNNSATLFVKHVLEVYDESKKLIKDLFNSDNVFEIAIDRAINEIVNHRYDKDKPSRSPDLVCKYCDWILKSSHKGKITQEEAQKELERAITVFRYIEDKDVFQRFYSRSLAKRLLNQSSQQDLESEMIKELRIVCGYEFISKLQCMYQDVRTSEGHTRKFNENFAAKGEPVDPHLTVNVLQTGAWPLLEPQTTFNLPDVLTRSFGEFCTFYKTNNKGKSLSWLHHLSTAEVKMQVTPKTYHVTLSTFQLSIVLLFNHTDQLSVSDISKATALPMKEIHQNLNALVNAEILKCQADISKEVNDAVVVCINENFHNKRTRFRVAVQQSTKEQHIETTKARASVEVDRKLYLRAAIARIMKSKRECQHNDLIQEVLTTSRGRFTPGIQLIKLTIEYLIDKTYLERHPDKKDTYLYVA